MKKACRAIIFAVIFTLLPGGSAFACRYNVRETGFVDLGMDPYVLCGYVDSNTAAAFSTSLKQVCDKELAQSNIIFRMVDIGKRADHAAMKYFDPNTQSAPCAVLISPDGQTMPVSITKAGEALEKSIRSAVKKILASPVRSKLMQEVAKMYGVILLIEGPEAEANAKAKKGALAAIEQVASQMEYMPKEIANRPALVVMDSNSVKSEEVLLWSLGVEAKDVNEPLAIIVYGRGRWVGPLYRGEQVNEDDLASVLFVVGADCECGLDYRWLQGTMLPAKWDRQLHERAVESLGFDPESPMIKMEIASIIGRGLGGRGYPSTPFGYQELIIESETDIDEPAVDERAEPEALESEIKESVDAGDAAETEEKTAEGACETEKVEDMGAAAAKEIEDKAGESERVEKAVETVEAVEESAEEAKGPEKAAETAAAAGKAKDSNKTGRGRADPNLIRKMLREDAGGGAGGDAKSDEDVLGAMHSTALLTIGLLAFIVIFGVAILARARRR